MRGGEGGGEKGCMKTYSQPALLAGVADQCFRLTMGWPVHIMEHAACGKQAMWTTKTMWPPWWGGGGGLITLIGAGLAGREGQAGTCDPASRMLQHCQSAAVGTLQLPACATGPFKHALPRESPCCALNWSF